MDNYYIYFIIIYIMDFSNFNVFSKEGLMTIGVVIVLIYLLVKLFGAQQMTIEGLTNKQKVPLMETMAQGNLKDLKKEIQQLDDVIRLDKYKSDYEDLLIDLDEIINQNILVNLVMFGDGMTKEIGNNKEDNDVILKTIKEYYGIKEILESTMQYIDGKSGSLGKSTSYFG
jgi:hypothetical protein